MCVYISPSYCQSIYLSPMLMKKQKQLNSIQVGENTVCVCSVSCYVVIIWTLKTSREVLKSETYNNMMFLFEVGVSLLFMLIFNFLGNILCLPKHNLRSIIVLRNSLTNFSSYMYICLVFEAVFFSMSNFVHSIVMSICPVCCSGSLENFSDCKSLCLFLILGQRCSILPIL